MEINKILVLFVATLFISLIVFPAHGARDGFLYVRAITIQSISQIGKIPFGEFPEPIEISFGQNLAAIKNNIFVTS